jgi:hypothetical protein
MADGMVNGVTINHSISHQPSAMFSEAQRQ